MSRNNKILVPEAREALNQLKTKVSNNRNSNSGNVKYEVANEVGVPLNKGYNGNLTSKEAGKVGGNIGGKMVHELVRMAEQQLMENYKK